MNAAVVLTNGGFMPVVGMEAADGHWIPAVEGHRVLWLADRTAFGGFSPGDFVIGIGMLALLGAWIHSLASRTAGTISTVSVTEGERMKREAEWRLRNEASST